MKYFERVLFSLCGFSAEVHKKIAVTIIFYSIYQNEKLRFSSNYWSSTTNADNDNNVWNVNFNNGNDNNNNKSNDNYARCVRGRQ